MPHRVPNTPTATQQRLAARDRASADDVRRAQEKWGEDPFDFLGSIAGLSDDDRSLRDAVSAHTQPKAGAVAKPSAEDMIDGILKPLFAERRRTMAKRAKERKWTAEVEARMARIDISAHVLSRNGTAAGGAFRQHRAAIVASKTRISDIEATIATIDARIAQRRDQIASIVAAALACEGGWRVVNGHVVNPKGRRLCAEYGSWERLSYVD